MAIATSAEYQEMLDRAKQNRFAYPALNVSSSQTLNAALAGLQAAGSDGIIQVSTGGADYWSGSTIKHRVTGALAFAAFAREVAKNYDIKVALHTDHCAEDQLDGFVRPLLELSAERVKAGGESIFNSHMWDGSAIALDRNLEIAKELLAKTHNVGAVLEIEVGAVGLSCLRKSKEKSAPSTARKTRLIWYSMVVPAQPSRKLLTQCLLESSR